MSSFQQADFKILMSEADIIRPRGATVGSERRLAQPVARPDFSTNSAVRFSIRVVGLTAAGGATWSFTPWFEYGIDYNGPMKSMQWDDAPLDDVVGGQPWPTFGNGAGQTPVGKTVWRTILRPPELVRVNIGDPASHAGALTISDPDGSLRIRMAVQVKGL